MEIITPADKIYSLLNSKINKFAITPYGDGTKGYSVHHTIYVIYVDIINRYKVDCDKFTLYFESFNELENKFDEIIDTFMDTKITIIKEKEKEKEFEEIIFSLFDDPLQKIDINGGIKWVSPDNRKHFFLSDVGKLRLLYQNEWTGDTIRSNNIENFKKLYKLIN